MAAQLLTAAKYELEFSTNDGFATLLTTSSSPPGGDNANIYRDQLTDGAYFGWDANSSVTSGNEVMIKIAIASPPSLVSDDLIKFELEWPFNDTPTRLNIWMGKTNLAGDYVLSPNLHNGGQKPFTEEIVLRQSDFIEQGGGSTDWTDIQEVRIVFKAITDLSIDPAAADYTRYIKAKRFSMGERYKTMVISSFDDNWSQLYSLGFDVASGLRDLGIPATLFITGNDELDVQFRATTTQVNEYIDAGWSIAPHNFEHQALASYSAALTYSSGTATLVTSDRDLDSDSVVSVGDDITLDRSKERKNDGTYEVTAITDTLITIDTAGKVLYDTTGDTIIIGFPDHDGLATVNQSRSELLGSGITAIHTDMMAYTFTYYADEVIDQLSGGGYQLMRAGDSRVQYSGAVGNTRHMVFGTVNDAQTFPQWPTHTIGAGATASSMLAQVDLAISLGAMYISFYGHNVGLENGVQDISQVEFLAFYDGLADRVISGDIDVGTFANLYNAAVSCASSTLTGPLTSALTRPLTTSLTGVSGPTPILLMPLVSNLNLSIGIGSAAFTRSTTGTYVDSGTGLVTTASIDDARFESNGALNEGSSANLFLSSDAFDNVIWTKFDVSVSANVVTSPDGSSNADSVIENTDNSIHRIRQSSINRTSGNEYTVSVYAKPIGSRFLVINANSYNNARASFNLALGTVDTVFAGSALIEPAANGFFRCSVTGTATSTGLESIFLQINTIGSVADQTYTGDGVSGITLWGAQPEELPFASSYIPTAGTTVTRSADNLSIDSDNIPVPTADYSVSLTSDFTGLDSSVSQVLFNVVGETSRRIEWNTTTGAIEATHGAVTSTSTSTFNPGDRVDIAFVVDGTNQTLYIDGVEEDQDAKGTATGTKTAINIGRQASTNQAYSHIKPLQIFDIALTPSEVASL